MAEKLIYESKKSKIYYLDKSELNQPVLLKILNFEFPTPKDISQFYNEFNIIDGLDIDSIRKALKCFRYHGKHAMYLEWINGKTVKEAFKGKQGDIRDFLHIAIEMAKSLGELHENNIIHKDISGNNFIVNLQDRSIKIIDFGIASRLSLKEEHLGNPEHLDGTLEYLSPEQTGRMNRVIDYRTDLYSLGVVYYEMLTGATPFQGLDPMGIIHGHIAVVPEPAHIKNPLVPKTISDIVSLLLAKNSEDRYQSGFGLMHDLKTFRNQFEAKAIVEAFTLRVEDQSGKFSLPQKLYGREEELRLLHSKLEVVARGGRELLLVAGYSGTGKSVLVREIHKPISQMSGYFVEGKFDQYQRDVPYYALIQAFEEFLEILLGENAQRFEKIRSDILFAVGEEGKVLTDVLPGLELIIGPQPEVPELGGSEAKNRFNYIFRRFTQAVARKEHPVVVFIDDLQWADSSSLGLLSSLVSDQDNAYLLFIGAYRDNEVNAAHPFINMVEDLRKSGSKIYELKIGNLSLEDVEHLIGDSIDKKATEVQDLARLVFDKTRGNAFFLTQFLRSLYEDELLYFHRPSKTWVYDLKNIQEKNITDNVVELMSNKILKLPLPTQDVIRLAACFGNKFGLETLALIYEKDETSTREDLLPALAEGLLFPKGENSYKFAHDRIQQAVYKLIPLEKRDIIHLEIGRVLLNSTLNEPQEEYLFDIVNQLNRGIKLIQDPVEKEKLCQLNLKAGTKARESSAFNSAYDYFVNGIRLLEEDPWKTQYDLSLKLYSLAGETAYLNGDFQGMDEKIRIVLEKAENLLEKVKSYEIRILAFKAENKLLEAIKTGLELLEQLGEKFPKKPRMVHVMAALAGSKIRLHGKDNDTLANLPEMSDQNKIAAMRIMAGIASSSYWATPSLFPLIIFRMVQLSLKYGNTALSSFAFATYGVIMCGVLGAMKSGYQFGKLGLILLEKFNAKEWKTQVYTPVYCLIVNWNEHIDKTLKPLQESYHIGMETGAIEFACINTNIYCIHSYLSGKPLERLEVETNAYSEGFKEFNQETNFNYNEVYRQAMLNLMGLSVDSVKLKGSAYDEDKMILQNKERNDQTGMFFLHFNKLILCYLLGEYDLGLKHAEESRKLLEAVLAKFEIPNHHYYEALTMLAIHEKSDKKKRIRLMRQVRKNAYKLKKWAKDAPENFQHKYDIIKAEILRIKGNFSEAALFYDKAIRGASEQNFIHEEAIAGELAGIFYINQNAANLAAHFLKSSYNAYREWGAQAKLRALEQKYPNYVSSVNSGTGLNSISMHSASTTGRSSSMNLDLSTILKASASISQEIVLNKLLKNLMMTVMENAGADRGILLLKEGEEFYIEAISEESGKSEEILQHLNYKGSGLLSETIVSYVTQSGKSALVQDAGSDRRFTHCGYIKTAPVQSVLCLPIINLGQQRGVLYLENNHSIAAFTPDRVDLMALLSGQIAVSISNAMLFENLELKVADRTKELEEEKKKSETLLLNILPLEIAEELKRNNTTTPRHFEKVTVMFTDFKGFTQLSELLSPADLVAELGACFIAFDKIIDKYKIEKIKTIGDSYMCVGGLPVPNSTHASDTIMAALEIRDWIDNYSKEAKSNGKPVFQIRIGLHTGPVVAGVVGYRKFAYDIWGDTVNTASRMESSGETGKVNISGQTHEIIKDGFECEYRGKVDAKNKGQIDMYFVEHLKSSQRLDN